MNYAEDRVDRRSRKLLVDVGSHVGGRSDDDEDDDSEEGDSSSSSRTKGYVNASDISDSVTTRRRKRSVRRRHPPDSLAFDLERSHSLLRWEGKRETDDAAAATDDDENVEYSSEKSSSSFLIHGPSMHAPSSLCFHPSSSYADADADVRALSLRRLKEGHELAGRTLRDCGLCRSATFHYAMAWMCDSDDARSAGDYAQMAEFSGFPEIGAIALLFYRFGGVLDGSVPIRLAKGSSVSLEKEEKDEDGEGHRDNRPVDSFRGSTDDKLTTSLGIDPFVPFGCGCGQEPCGDSPCHLPIRRDDPILADVLSSLACAQDCFDSLHERKRLELPKAASILEILSQKAKSVGGKRTTTGTNERSRSRCDVPNSLLGESFAAVRFWEETLPMIWPDNQSRPSGVDNNDKGGVPRRGLRTLPPLLQILLLKLLYVAPVAGPFLSLACEAVAHMSAAMPLSSCLGRSMATNYKSHWAYFVLIRAVVLGERVKAHRRGTAVPYHVPVWDVVHGLDGRSFDRRPCSVITRDSTGGERSGVGGSSFAFAFVAQLRRAVDACSMDRITDVVNSSVNGVLPCVAPYVPDTIVKFSPCPLFVLGDSHVLSIAWQLLRIPGARTDEYGEALRLAVPFPSTGIKAWHTRSGTRFFTHYNLRSCLSRLPSTSRTILLSAGEIDVREGIGGKLLEGYYSNCDDAVRNTVREYYSAAERLAKEFDRQILLLPVAPHAYRSEKNGKSTGRALRRARTELWNDVLREVASRAAAAARRPGGVFLLDYERDLRAVDDSSPVGYVLNKSFNADFTHTNSAILPLIEEAIQKCGCDISLI